MELGARENTGLSIHHAGSQCFYNFKLLTHFFCKHFIMVRMAIYPEPILGTLGVRSKYTSDGTSQGFILVRLEG